jgi:hypothetical protein
MPKFVSINFILLYSKHQLDHYSAINVSCCYVDVLFIDIYFSLQVLNGNELLLQVWQAKSRLLCKNEGWTENNAAV